MGTGVARLKAL